MGLAGCDVFSLVPAIHNERSRLGFEKLLKIEVFFLIVTKLLSFLPMPICKKMYLFYSNQFLFSLLDLFYSYRNHWLTSFRQFCDSKWALYFRFVLSRKHLFFQCREFRPLLFPRLEETASCSLSITCVLLAKFLLKNRCWDSVREQSTCLYVRQTESSFSGN